WLAERLPSGSCVAFDGNLASLLVAQTVKDTLEPLGIEVDGHVNLLSSIWHNRPELPKVKAFLIGEAFTGQSTESKLEAVRAELTSSIYVHRIIWRGF